MANYLTEKQARVLAFAIETLVETGRIPTLRAISEGLGYATAQGVKQHIDSLLKKGYISRDQTHGFVIVKDERGRPVSVSIGHVGRKEPREDQIVRGLNLPEAASIAGFAVRRLGERGWRFLAPDEDGREATLSITPSDAMAVDWEAW